MKDAEILVISTDTHVHSRCMLHKYLSHERDEKTLSFVPEDFFETNHISWIKDKTVTSIDTEASVVILQDGSKDHERDEKTLSFVPEDFFETNHISWIKDKTVTSIDTEASVVILQDGSKESYDRLLIATGAHSFIPPVGQFREANNVFGLRDLSDAQAIRPLADKAENILVVGSGLVGMDAAYAFLEQK